MESILLNFDDGCPKYPPGYEPPYGPIIFKDPSLSPLAVTNTPQPKEPKKPDTLHQRKQYRHRGRQSGHVVVHECDLHLEESMDFDSINFKWMMKLSAFADLIRYLCCFKLAGVCVDEVYQWYSTLIYDNTREMSRISTTIWHHDSSVHRSSLGEMQDLHRTSAHVFEGRILEHSDSRLQPLKMKSHYCSPISLP